MKGILCLVKGVHSLGIMKNWTNWGEHSKPLLLPCLLHDDVVDEARYLQCIHSPWSGWGYCNSWKSDMWMCCWVSSFKSVYTYNRQWVYCNMSCDNTVIMLLKCIFIYFLQKINFVYSCFCSTICSCGSNSHSVSRTFLYGWGSTGNRSSAGHGDWQNMLLFLPIILFYYSFKFCLLFSLTLPTKIF